MTSSIARLARVSMTPFGESRLPLLRPGRSDLSRSPVCKCPAYKLNARIALMEKNVEAEAIEILGIHCSVAENSSFLVR